MSNELATFIDLHTIRFFVDLLRATFVFVCVFYTTRLLDYVAASSKSPFYKGYEILCRDPRALGQYYGLRFCGVAYIYSSSFS